MRRCPFCGGGRRMERVEGALACPRCGGALDRLTWRKSELFACASCKGTWVPSADFKRLTSERDVIRDDDAPEEFVPGPLRRETGYLACPVCRALMPRTNFKRISGVLIDTCRDHGVWLDRGELEQIRAFIADGGLDRVRDADIAANRERLESFATRLRDLEFMEKVLHPRNFKRWIFRNL